MSTAGVQGKMARGALWMLLLTSVDRSLGIVSTLILARLLVPADFGLVSMALSFIFMAQLLTAFGFDVALIHRKDATRAHYDSAWTLNVVLGASVLLLMLIAAGPVAHFYAEPNVFWVVCTLAWVPLIAGFENIGVVAFRKDLDFRKEFRFQIIRRLVGSAVTLPLAFWLRNYWALVAGTIAARLAGTIASYLVHHYRPRFSLAEVSSLFAFSKWLLLNNVVGFLKERSSDFVVGRMRGAASLGVYNISYEIAIMPTTELSAPINRALLPGFARIAHDPDSMRAAYQNAIGMLALIAVPAAAGIFAVAPYLVPVALGQKWLAGVPLMEILAFNGGLLLFHSSICTVLIANGYPDRVMKTNGAYVVALLALFALLVPTYGLPGAAYAALGASVLGTPVYLWQVQRSVGIPASVFLRAAYRPVVAACAMALMVRWVLPEWTAQLAAFEAISWLLGGVAIGIVTYTLVLTLLWLSTGRPAGAERIVFGEARKRLWKQAPVTKST